MIWIVAIGVVGAGCAAEPSDPSSRPIGAAQVDVAAVQRHARQFDSELSPRGPGSQREFAAAAYIVGHLQQAGYVARLDPVPVGNLVEASNVVALAPGGNPSMLVVVAYDDAARGDTIGLWLELARALRAAQPEHRVQLVAVGAEAGDPGRLGTRRLIRTLTDADETVAVLTLSVRSDSNEVDASGTAARAVTDFARDIGIETVVSELDADDLWVEAGFEHTHIVGPTRALGELLLEFLTREDS